MPLRIACTPAMKVVATAPMPGRRIPSLPIAGLTSTPFLSAIGVAPRSPYASDWPATCQNVDADASETPRVRGVPGDRSSTVPDRASPRPAKHDRQRQLVIEHRLESRRLDHPRPDRDQGHLDRD